MQIQNAEAPAEAGRWTVVRSCLAACTVLLFACGDQITPSLHTSSTTTAAPLPQVISVTPQSSVIAVGQTARLFVGVTADPGVSSAVLWSSSTPGVATV